MTNLSVQNTAALGGFGIFPFSSLTFLYEFLGDFWVGTIFLIGILFYTYLGFLLFYNKNFEKNQKAINYTNETENYPAIIMLLLFLIVIVVLTAINSTSYVGVFISPKYKDFAFFCYMFYVFWYILFLLLLIYKIQNKIKK